MALQLAEVTLVTSPTLYCLLRTSNTATSRLALFSAAVATMMSPGGVSMPSLSAASHWTMRASPLLPPVNAGPPLLMLVSRIQLMASLLLPRLRFLLNAGPPLLMLW